MRQRSLEVKIGKPPPISTELFASALEIRTKRREGFLKSHEGIDPAATPSGNGCVECLASNGWWLHLRRCAPCGHIGCCDSSPNQHATKHFQSTGHLIAASFEPGEMWFWNYETQQMMEKGRKLAPSRWHPEDQAAPGPAGKVPRDWQSHLH
jgi:hypothetical protein